jgi:hypothetical protein
MRIIFYQLSPEHKNISISLNCPLCPQEKATLKQRLMMMVCPFPKPNVHLKIQWAKNPDCTFTLIESLGDNVRFRLKLFSDSTADAARENQPKLTAKESKSQQYAILAKHIFSTEPGQSALFLQDPGRYGVAVETHLQW